MQDLQDFVYCTYSAFKFKRFISITISSEKAAGIVLLGDSNTPVASLTDAPATMVLVDENNQTVTFCVDKKRRADDEPAVDSKSQKVDDSDDSVTEPPYFIDFKVLTTDVLKACIEFSKPIPIEGKCTVVYINFNYKKFAEITGVLP